MRSLKTLTASLVFTGVAATGAVANGVLSGDGTPFGNCMLLATPLTNNDIGGTGPGFQVSWRAPGFPAPSWIMIARDLINDNSAFFAASGATGFCGDNLPPFEMLSPQGDSFADLTERAGILIGKGTVGEVFVGYTPDVTPPTVTLSGPTDVVTEDFTVTFAFSETVSNFTSDDVTVTNGTKGTFTETTTGTTYTLVVSPVLGTTVSVSVGADAAEDAAGNGNTASDVFEVEAGSPASKFERYEEEIRAVVVDEAARSLQSTIAANQRMTRDARTRFIQSGQAAEDDSGVVSRNNVAFDVDGTFAVNDTTVSTSGEFFQQTGNYEGTQRRLFFGDFDVQHDGDTGSTTATLTGRVAWERMLSDITMLGYFVGGELAYSDIEGAFTGNQERLGATIGAYAVHALDEQLFLDGFLTLGAGRNNLEMANDVLALTSDYTTRTATAGAALSGVYEYERYEFRPELAFSYGKTWIGNVGFTGRAYGLVDDTLSLDAGNVAVANLTLRPEVVWALDAGTVAESNSQFSFAPRLICERIEAGTVRQDCGGGAELGIAGTSEDGLSNINARIVMDRIGDTTRSGLQLNIEHRF